MLGHMTVVMFVYTVRIAPYVDNETLVVNVSGHVIVMLIVLLLWLVYTDVVLHWTAGCIPCIEMCLRLVSNSRWCLSAAGTSNGRRMYRV